MNRRQLVIGSVAGVVGAFVPFTVESVHAFDSADTSLPLAEAAQEDNFTTFLTKVSGYTEDGSYYKAEALANVFDEQRFLLAIYPQFKTYEQDGISNYPYGLIYTIGYYTKYSISSRAIFDDLANFVAAYEKTSEDYSIPFHVRHENYDEKITDHFTRVLMDNYRNLKG